MDSRRALLAALAFAAALVMAGCQTTGSDATASQTQHPTAARPAGSGPMVGVGY
jgi:hypothetical protein